jgi:MFS transporter, CP family, cyanate transporter
MKANPAYLVILAGVAAALHVGKLSPALPILRESLGVSLMQAGFLLSMVQFSGMLLGLVVGGAADGWGLRRTLISGLLMLSLASGLGALAPDANTLLWTRALEGLGFLLVIMPAPSLVRQLVEAQRLSKMMGMWGTFMPLGTGIALLFGPLVIVSIHWQGWWWALSALSFVMALWIWRSVPRDGEQATPANIDAHDLAAQHWRGRLTLTLRSPGPWLVALSFAVYSAQWLAVIGFLPIIYAQAGFAASSTAVLTSVVAAVNMLGNIASGRLLSRGIAAHHLLYVGCTVMGLGACLAFQEGWVLLLFGNGEATVRFLAVLLFSMVGGVIPGTLFTLAVRLAPTPKTVSTTVGWMQQWSATGQFLGPPLVAWVAAGVGDWHLTWLVTGACALAGLFLARQIGRRMRG